MPDFLKALLILGVFNTGNGFLHMKVESNTYFPLVMAFVAWFAGMALIFTWSVAWYYDRKAELARLDRLEQEFRHQQFKSRGF